MSGALSPQATEARSSNNRLLTRALQNPIEPLGGLSKPNGDSQKGGWDSSAAIGTCRSVLWRAPFVARGYKFLRSPAALVSSLMGRTSILPTWAGGICEAIWMAWFSSAASIK